MSKAEIKKKRRVLVIDDEKDICTLLSMLLMRMGIGSDTAGSVAEAIDILAKREYDFCVTDMRLPDGEGLQIVEHCADKYIKMPIAVLTAHANMSNAILALKAGAFDYLAKPISKQKLQDLLNVAFSMVDINNNSKKLQNKNVAVASGIENQEVYAEGQRVEIGPLDTLIGNSPIMQNLKVLVEKLGRSNVPVFICGESGSGKELVARAIHNLSGRAKKPFVAVNCGAIPESLTESEFFGYRKGAFTGADDDREGLFQAAHHGSLFLDEIADLPLLMQVKLLRAIQEKSIRRVGDTKEVAVDVRIISATHKNLFELIGKGHFREDLYYRLNVLEIVVAPLRDRIEDVSLIARAILDKISSQIKISAGAISKLKDYSYPGNVRELENILERAVAISNGKQITEADLWFNSLASDEVGVKLKEAIISSVRKSAISGNKALDMNEMLDGIRRDLVIKTYESTGQNIKIASIQLGMSIEELENYLKKYKIA